MKIIVSFTLILLLLMNLPATSFAEQTLDGSVEEMVRNLFTGWPEKERKARTAVLPFYLEDSDDVTSLGTYLAETVTDLLVARHQCPVVSRTRLKDLLEELEFQQEDLVNKNTRQDIGQFTGAELMILGSFWNLGDTVKISVRLYSLEAAYALAAASCIVEKDLIPPSFREELVRKKPKIGTISFSTMPKGAKVFCYDLPKRYLGKTTEPFQQQLPPRTYRFKFQLEGFRPEVRTVDLKAAQEVDLAIELKEEEGTVSLEVEPEHAQLYLDGSPVKAGSIKISTGLHVLSATCAGYRQKSRQFNMNDGQDLSLKLALVPVGGRLTFHVTPDDATVSIEGVSLPKEKWSYLALEPGSYLVEIEKPGWQRQIREVTLEDGQVQTLHIELAKEAQTNPPASPERIVTIDIPEDPPPPTAQPTYTPRPMRPIPTPQPEHLRPRGMTIFIELERFALVKVKDLSVSVDGQHIANLAFRGEVPSHNGKLKRTYRFYQPFTPGSHEVVVRGRATSGPFSRSFKRFERLFVPRGRTSSQTLFIGLITL